MNPPGHVGTQNIRMIIAHDLVHVVSDVWGVEPASLARQVLVEMLVQCTVKAAFDRAAYLGGESLVDLLVSLWRFLSDLFALYGTTHLGGESLIDLFVSLWGLLSNLFAIYGTTLKRYFFAFFL
jgi:hypothetical protein